MTQGPAPIVLEEPQARRVLLVQAIETVDERGRLISEAERDQAEQAVIARRGGVRSEPPDAASYLPARAAELLQTVEARNPALARLEARDAWWDRLGVVLPLAALVAGFASDRLFNSGRTDLLSIPLVGVAAWNVIVYALLALSALRRRAADADGWPDRVERALLDLPTWFTRRAAARLRESAAARFRLLWWKAAGRLEAARVHRTLHLGAAAWALGVVLSIVVTGLNTRFRVGWESTWLGPQQVHAVLGVMATPARALGLEAFSLDEVRQLEFGAQAAAGQPQARKWALVYIVFIFTLVVLPRLVLWAWARARARAFARKIALDPGDAYFAHVIARVSPARIVIDLRAADERGAAFVAAMMSQAADPREGAAGGELRTPQGDSLTVARNADDADFTLVVGGAASPPERPAFEIMGDVAACWALEQPIHDWLRANAADAKRAGLARLLDQWSRHHASRWQASMEWLGAALAESASDSEEVKSRWGGPKEREAATAELLARLQARLDRLHAELLRLHATRAGALAHGLAGGPGRADWMQQGGAGAAGAIAGALAGAKIDLVTGGLTLGAGMALGALLGGAGAFTAARSWIMGSTVRLSDEQLQALAESMVTQYVAVIHAGRALDLGDGRIPPSWSSEAVAAIAARAADLQRAAKRARDGDAKAAHEMAALLRDASWRVLGALYGPQRLCALPQATP